MTRLRALALTAVLLGVSASPAGAATVTATSTSYDGYKGSGETVTTVKVVAADGERNVLTVESVASATASAPVALIVRDAGAPLTAGIGCAAQADGSVRCASAGNGPMYADVAAGDGDDSVVGSGGVSLILRGGDGNDTLDASGGDSTNVLDGGAGDDVLVGGPGGDTLDGGTGHDRISGGAGLDEVTYRDRQDPVTATIGSVTAGDEDEIADDVEQLTGGRGADHLTGSEHRDYLDGGPGADTLDGRGGDDDLRADDTNYSIDKPTPTPAADDVLLGGPGNDVLTLSRGGHGRGDGGAGSDNVTGVTAAAISGGPGRDRLTLTGSGGTIVADDDGAAGDLVACGSPDAAARLGPSDVSSGCGRGLHRAGPLPGALAIAFPAAVENGISDARSSLLALLCAEDARRGCAIRITVLDDRGHAVGHARRRLKPGGHAEVVVPFTAAYGRRLLRARALPVTFVASMRDTRGRVRSDRYAYCAQAVNVFVDTPAACG